MNNAFFSLIFRQKYIKRWGLMRNINEENLSSHSFEVAVLAHALAVIGNTYFDKNYDAERICTIALFHDAEEVYTGDMPTPIKYFNPEMRENYRLVEQAASASLLSKLPDELKPVYSELLNNDECDIHKIIKAADKLAAYIKCIEEEKCGNAEFAKASKATKKSLEEMNCEELSYFMENMLPSFLLTIDEI